MNYRIDIMQPGKSAGPVFASFESDSPFMRIAAGDLIDPATFSNQAPGQLFEVLHVLHGFEQKPEGAQVQTMSVYTSKLYDCASLRSQLTRRAR